MSRFYLDTSIWIDFYEDRKGYNGEPIGDFALNLFSIIKAKNYRLIITDLLINELGSIYSSVEIEKILDSFKEVTEKIEIKESQISEAKEISKKRNLPAGDVLHAIIARDNSLLLITRDRHFKDLLDIAKHYKPEEII